MEPGDQRKRQVNSGRVTNAFVTLQLRCEIRLAVATARSVQVAIGVLRTQRPER